MLIALLSFIGRLRRKSQEQQPRRPPSRPQRRRLPLEEPTTLQVPGERRRVEVPLPWETRQPEELQNWDEESEIPAAWLPDFEPELHGPGTSESPRELLERLARGAEAVARQAAVSETPQPSQPGRDVAAPALQRGAALESMRLTQLRQRLSSPQSLREVLLLREILGPPRSQRRGSRRF